MTTPAPLYKSPNVFYLGDPVDTIHGRGIIKKFGKKDTVWVELDRDRKNWSGHLQPMSFKDLKRIS